MKNPFKKPVTAIPAPSTALALDGRYSALLTPLQDDAPCGLDLEYHPDLLVLQNRASPQQSAQYGNFLAPAENVNWREMEASLMTILKHGKDLRALVLLLRSRIQQAGAKGAYEGLYLLAQTVQRFGKDVHPQHLIDGEPDPGVRANALAALVDETAVLADLRQIMIDNSAASRLSLRDVERALAIPRAPDALNPDSLNLQLSSLRAQQNEVLTDLEGAHAQAVQINTWAHNDLGTDAPDLSALLRLLSPFVDGALLTQTAHAHLIQVATTNPSASTTPHETTSTDTDAVGLNATENPIHPVTSVPSSHTPSHPTISHTSTAPDITPLSRQDALALVRIARLWFEANEPSSPVADLLRQAEKLTGKSYLEIADAIPLDLLARWRSNEAH